MKNKTKFIRSKFSPVNKNRSLIRPNSNSNFSEKKTNQNKNSDKKDYKYGENTSKTQDNVREYDSYNNLNTINCNIPTSGNKRTQPNFNSNNNNNNISFNNTQHQFDISDLVFSVQDDFKTVLNKNNRLRNLLIQASNKINELTIKSKERDEEYRVEKARILSELDKISANYITYAEGYKNSTAKEHRIKNLQNDYNHNYKVLTGYQESIR